MTTQTLAAALYAAHVAAADVDCPDTQEAVAAAILALTTSVTGTQAEQIDPTADALVVTLANGQEVLLTADGFSQI